GADRRRAPRGRGSRPRLRRDEGAEGSTADAARLRAQRRAQPERDVPRASPADLPPALADPAKTRVRRRRLVAEDRSAAASQRSRVPDGARQEDPRLRTLPFASRVPHTAGAVALAELRRIETFGVRRGRRRRRLTSAGGGALRG